MLLDKGYFDYDFEKFGMIEPGRDWVDTVRSDQEIADIMSGFGFGRRKKPETTDEIQKYIINQIKED